MLKYILIFIASTTICFGQQQKCLLFYNNETNIKGYAKVTSDDQIEFSLTLDGKTEILDYNVIKKVIIYDKEPIVYEYFKTLEEEPKLLRLLVSGMPYSGNDARLYVSAKEARTPELKDGNKVPVAKRYFKLYYLKKRFDDALTLVNSELTPTKWRRKMLIYFKDCPEVKEKLRYGGFSSKSMINLVEEYNFYCID